MEGQAKLSLCVSGTKKGRMPKAAEATHRGQEE